jgi:ABC-type multidrug transport system fused ATPase/permease subunit
VRTVLDRLHRLLTADASGPQPVAAAPAARLRDVARRFWPLARPYRAKIVLGLGALVAIPAVETAEIWVFKSIVDEVLVPGALAPLAALAAALVGLALLNAALSFADEYLAAWVGERFLLELRVQVFEHVQELGPSTLDRRRLGDLITRLTGDVAAIETFLLTGFAEAIGALARVVFFSAALALLSWKLALASLIVVPLFALAARAFSRLARRAAREKRRRSGSLAALAEEALANFALTQLLNRQRAESARLRAQGEGIVAAELAAVRIRGVFGPAIDLIELLGALVLLTVGVWLLSRGELTLGELLASLTLLAQLLGPVRDLSSLSATVFAAAAGAERVLELLDERPAVGDARDAVALERPRGLVELHEVSYRHPGAARDALRGVSLRVQPGETVALAGPSGAGKSTLSRLLVRFDDPSAGAVRLDGHDLRDLTRASVREHVGLLLQETLLPDVAIGEAIAMGRPGATPAEIRAAARAAGIHEEILALPDGYDERLGQRGRRLSGGQRQRVAIARALVRDTPVLVLDEPTTGLDAGAKAAVLEPLRRLAATRTTILISHDPDVLAWADRVVCLADGMVQEPASEATALT